MNTQNVHKPRLDGTPVFELVYAPDFVGCDVPRRFLVEIEFKGSFEPTIPTYDKTLVKLLGQRDIASGVTEAAAALPKGQKRKLRRYYFQTRKRSEMTEVVVKGSSGSIIAPIVIWDYSDLRKPKLVSGTELPRRYPLGSQLRYLKQRRVLPKKPAGYKREPVAPTGFVQRRAKFCETFNMKDFTLEEFWRITPECSLAMRKNHPGDIDPVHGDAVYKAAGDGFYPYKMTMPEPGEVDSYYLISPIDNRKIPDNDWAAGDYTGAFMDDGVNGIELADGKQHYYISQYFVMRGIHAYDMVKQAAELYESTGKAYYARLALTGMVRIGLEHNYLSVLLNHRRGHLNRYKDHTLVEVAARPAMMGNCGFLFDGIWTTQSMRSVIWAYDKVFDGIKHDKVLFAFLKSKGLDIDSPDELKRFIEENVFLTYLQAMLDGSQQYNFPVTQLTFLELIRILDYPTNELMELVYQGDGNYLVNGLITPLFTAGYYRDGIKAESLGGYNRNGIASLYEIYTTVRDLLENSTQAFSPETFPRPDTNRKFLTAMESMVEHATTPYTRVFLGDGGPMVGYRRHYENGEEKTWDDSKNFLGDELPMTFNNVYRAFPSAKLAWAMINSSAWELPEEYPYTLEQIKANAAMLPKDWRVGATALPGPGISLIRSGLGENERALYQHYGHIYGGHAQDSTMGLFLDAFKARLVTMWGYPVGWDRWYYSWFSQNTGRHFPVSRDNGRYFMEQVLEGVNELTVDSGNFRVVDNRADLVHNGYGSKRLELKPTEKRYHVLDDGWQRRVNFLVDVSDEEFYIIDFYRMIGGKDHWRIFGTLDGNVETKDLQLVKQQGGTLAGKEVAYDDREWVDRFANQGHEMSNQVLGLGFVRLTNVERAHAGNPFEVLWNVAQSDGLKLKVSSLLSDNVEVVLADAREPSNANPMVRRMLLWHHSGPDKLKSQVLNVFEGFRKSPVVKKSRSVNVTGLDEKGFEPAGLEIELANRKDYVIISASESTKTMKLPDGRVMTLNGRIGCISVDNDGNVIAKNLISGTMLSVGDE